MRGAWAPFLPGFEWVVGRQLPPRVGGDLRLRLLVRIGGTCSPMDEPPIRPGSTGESNMSALSGAGDFFTPESSIR